MADTIPLQYAQSLLRLAPMAESRAARGTGDAEPAFGAVAAQSRG